MQTPPGVEERRSWFKSNTYALLKPFKVDRAGKHLANLLVLQGGMFALPDDLRLEFIRRYAMEQPRFNFSFVEMRGDVFPMLFDIDKITEEALAMGRGFRDTFEAATRAAIAEFLDCDAAAQTCKWQKRANNLHIVWPDTLVDTPTAMALVKRVNELLEEQHPTTGWGTMIDCSVVDKNGLRMLGSLKMWKHQTLREVYPDWCRDYVSSQTGLHLANF